MRSTRRLAALLASLLLACLSAACASVPTGATVPTVTYPATTSTSAAIPPPCIGTVAAATVPSTALYVGTSYCVTLPPDWKASAPASDTLVNTGMTLTTSSVGGSAYTLRITPLAAKAKKDCPDLAKCVVDWGTAYIKAAYGVDTIPASAAVDVIDGVSGVTVEFSFTAGGTSYNGFFTGVIEHDVVFVVDRTYPDGPSPFVGALQSMLHSIRFF